MKKKGNWKRILCWWKGKHDFFKYTQDLWHGKRECGICNICGEYRTTQWKKQIIITNKE